MITKKQMARTIELIIKMRQYGQFFFRDKRIYQLEMDAFYVEVVPATAFEPGSYAKLDHTNFNSLEELLGNLVFATTLANHKKIVEFIG